MRQESSLFLCLVHVLRHCHRHCPCHRRRFLLLLVFFGLFTDEAHGCGGDGLHRSLFDPGNLLVNVVFGSRRGGSGCHFGCSYLQQKEGGM